jgi:hypothetical protein
MPKVPRMPKVPTMPGRRIGAEFSDLSFGNLGIFGNLGNSNFSLF